MDDSIQYQIRPRQITQFASLYAIQRIQKVHRYWDTSMRDLDDEVECRQYIEILSMSSKSINNFISFLTESKRLHSIKASSSPAHNKAQNHSFMCPCGIYTIINAPKCLYPFMQSHYASSFRHAARIYQTCKRPTTPFLKTSNPRPGNP